jgi:tetratricopeptide (TPR) repeat protein
MANAIARKGDPEKALSIYEDLAKSHPRDPGPHFHRGRMFALMGRDQEAVAAFEKALELAPREGRAKLLHTLVRAAAKDKAKALEYYRQYISEGYARDPDLERQLEIRSDHHEKYR